MAPTTRMSPRPMFPTRSRLEVGRDVAVLTVCIGIVLGFLVEVWSGHPPPIPTAPASVVVAMIDGNT